MALVRTLYIGSRLERVMCMMRGEGGASPTTSTSVDLLRGIPAEAREGDRQSGVRRSRVEGREGAGGKRFKTAKKKLLCFHVHLSNRVTLGNFLKITLPYPATCDKVYERPIREHHQNTAFSTKIRVKNEPNEWRGQGFHYHSHLHV